MILWVLLVGGLPPQAGPAQEIALPEFTDRLRHFREEHGVAPSFVDFLRLGSDAKGRSAIAKRDRRDAWNALQELQRPEISKADLLQLHEATRAAIVDLDMHCEAEQRKFVPGQAPIVQRHRTRFAVAGGKVHLHSSEETVSDRPTRTTSIGYDGSVVRRSGQEGGITAGWLTAFESRSIFYRADTNILFGTMLLDSAAALGMELRHSDMKLFLSLPEATVFEKRKVVDGADCIVLGDGAADIYVDPARTYSVVGVFEYAFPDDAAPYISSSIELSDFVDCGNGIWLPRMMRRRFYEKPGGPEALVTEETAKVTDLRVNTDIPDSVFSDIIPRGTVVLDAVRNVTYVEGEAGSIQSTLERFAPIRVTSPRQAFPIPMWLIMVLANAVVLAVILALAALRRRRASGPRSVAR